MTTDRIRWCMQCNLIATSRRCPRCGKDVLNLRIDNGSSISPVFNQQANHIRNYLDTTYGEGCGKLLLPEENTSLFAKMNGSRQMIVNGGIVGKVSDSGSITLNASAKPSGTATPTLRPKKSSHRASQAHPIYPKTTRGADI